MTDFNFDEFTKSFGFPPLKKSNIVRTQVSDRVDLIYLSDLGKAGIHIRGLASMLNCAPMVISRSIEGVSQDNILELEMQTAGGLQGVTFILERGVVQVLKSIRRSNCAQATKDAAEELYDRFAEAGFKLYAMLEVAPEALIPNGYHKSPPQTDEFAEMRARVELAKSLAGNPGAIEAYKSLFHAPQPLNPPSSPPPPKTKPIPNADDIVKDFLSKLDILAEKGLVGEWSFTVVRRNLTPYKAVHLADVWLLILKYFEPSYDRVTLQSAILFCGGEVGSTQKFLPKSGGIKKTEQRRCVLIPITARATK